ncbi:small GTP-binding protein domain [Spizellomyces punctatus DAOM BR117]|uniref:Small GTP-binding protein domain n=1 Tax=Spizellomyces punctatus (strain DAOM BR117) TaxID=645134 RepID=A0A0L0H821_SPIPD|nr:small GTP-binding protein domain [Spizellomyces punctatus DAOM BR117]KNC97675.1 small GTP-binding protein domain [Spizellomyces punctatus DAOM BR117]|eukprot:XP_016605715.1 small GTP-binding protein domain [Spizellomyces punctatus DAOM BR117]
MLEKRKRAKLVCVGDEGVGKTALLLVYSGGQFPEKHLATVTETYLPKDSPFEIWDTAGAAELDRLRPFSYDKADAFIVAFSVVDHQSFQNIEERWIPEIRYFASNVPILLVGCKSDLRTDPETLESLRRIGYDPIRYDEGEQVAKRMGAYRYLECSARTRSGVAAIFEEAGRSIDYDKDLRHIEAVTKPFDNIAVILRRQSSLSTVTTAVTGISRPDWDGEDYDEISPGHSIHTVAIGEIRANVEILELHSLEPKDDETCHVAECDEAESGVIGIESPAANEEEEMERDSKNKPKKFILGGDPRKARDRVRIGGGGGGGGGGPIIRRASAESSSIASVSTASAAVLPGEVTMAKEADGDTPAVDALRPTETPEAVEAVSSPLSLIPSKPAMGPSPSRISPMTMTAETPISSSKTRQPKSTAGCQCTIL